MYNRDILGKKVNSMSFKENAYQQMSFTDSFSGLTAREQKALEKSWAKVFADEIFPAIDEKRFSVLYSDKASRPNTPVNVIVGALIIKELFDYSDDEMVENLMLDFRIQYALHTTSFEEQPLADFEFNEKGTKVLRCPAGHSPKSCSYMKQSSWKTAWQVLFWFQNSSVEFPKTLQLCEGSGKLCPKSGT